MARHEGLLTIRPAACRWGAWKAEGCATFEKKSTAALQPLQPLKLAPRKRKAPGAKVDTGVPAINKCGASPLLTDACIQSMALLQHIALSLLSTPGRVAYSAQGMAWACRLRNAYQDNVSCLTGKGNKRFAPGLREFMQPVITEMDPEECVEDQYKVCCNYGAHMV